MKIYRPFHTALVVLVSWAVVGFANGAELEIVELVSAIKKAVAEAQKTAGPPYMTIPWMEAEIKYVVKKEGEAGFKLYVVTVEGTYATETVQSVKFRLEPPGGKGWKVESPRELKDVTFAIVNAEVGQVYVKWPGGSPDTVIQMKVAPSTKITDSKGKFLNLWEINQGSKGSVSYSWNRAGELFLDSITVNKSGKYVNPPTKKENPPQR